jgi:hypothetical protein
VIELCRHITGTGMAPTELVMLAASMFLECDVLSCKRKAIAIHDAIHENAQAMNWHAIVRTLKNKYQSVKGQELWTPQLTTKKRDNKISGLHVTLSKLSAQVNSGSSGKHRGTDGKEPPHCYECGKLGHISPDCSKKQGSFGLQTPPKEGELQTKLVNGASHSWCSICQQWTTGDKEHATKKYVHCECPAAGTSQPPG